MGNIDIHYCGNFEFYIIEASDVVLKGPPLRFYVGQLVHYWMMIETDVSLVEKSL